MQILDAMNQDSGIPLTQLQVDGGMTSNRLLMQLQADILCIPVGEVSFCFFFHFWFSVTSNRTSVLICTEWKQHCPLLEYSCSGIRPVKPSMPETTALGAAMAAGAAEGVSVWSLSPEDLSEVTSEKFEPQINTEGAPAAALHVRHTICAAAVTLKLFCVSAESEFRYARWKKAVQKSMSWETTEPVCNGNGMQFT